MVHLTQGLLIGFFGSALYYAVDRYDEPDRATAFMLKFLVMMWRAAAIFRCIGFFGSDSEKSEPSKNTQT
jgi:hypothetical protein